ncbi:hypothetical protein NDU88_006343 [Pleurodeles waltl]|uniref:Uncharacterized protein n=1 Tax=Pleurodeles waltl TaxID=8319 RepID=A0AAV7RLB5_PLEWA|nr:hypothetical protein NDU88_006343 [Pleurodeles waltl]
MGKHDAKQPKLNFDHKRSTCQGELVQGPQATEERDLAADDQGEDLRTLMLEMRSSLRNIDTKLDNLANQWAKRHEEEELNKVKEDEEVQEEASENQGMAHKEYRQEVNH